ncbi:MAG TPA: glycosyltransferase family 87 protein [Anaeromyxobacter sp.]|nr:glycosyltransferase family 87 protein [Anaeromyxobacter sp.]
MKDLYPKASVRTWILLGLAILGAGLVCTAGRNDFLAFYDAGEAALRHGDVYAQGPRMRMHVFYAPTFSLLLMPFALLPPYAAAWLWYGLKVLALSFLARWVLAAVRAEAPGQGPRARIACVALPFAVAFNPFMGEFRLGQANLFVLLFTVLTVRCLERGRPLRAALYFSLAAIKITPLALLPWLASRRQWRFLAALLPVGAAWLAALAAWWGPTRVPGLFAEWIRVTATVKAIPEKVAYFENQSLQGTAARLALLLPGLERPVLGVPAYQWLWIVPCALIAGVLILSAGRDRFRSRLPPEEFALGSLLMLLASSDSRYAHHVQLLVPLAVLSALSARVGLFEALPRVGGWFARGEMAAERDEGTAAAQLRRRVAVLVGTGLAVLVLLGRDVVGPTVNEAVRALSFHTLFDLSLVVFLARRLLRREETGPSRELTSLAFAPGDQLFPRT